MNWASASSLKFNNDLKKGRNIFFICLFVCFLLVKKKKKIAIGKESKVFPFTSNYTSVNSKEYTLLYTFPAFTIFDSFFHFKYLIYVLIFSKLIHEIHSETQHKLNNFEFIDIQINLLFLNKEN